MIGKLYRDGTLYTDDIMKVKDHDFPSYAEGKIVPHGLYDINLNVGYITIGTSGDTSEFACASIKKWWLDYGHIKYKGHTKLLLLCDGGGQCQ